MSTKIQNVKLDANTTYANGSGGNCRQATKVLIQYEIKRNR
jgi:hypothetical protein